MKKSKKLLFQCIFAFVAVLITTLTGCFYGSYIIRKNMASLGNEVVKTSVENLNARIYETKATLKTIALSIEKLEKKGSDMNELLDEMVLWTNFSSYGVYGVLDGVYLDGSLSELPTEYIAESYEWYKGAFFADGDIYSTDIYMDTRINDYVITASTLVYNESGAPFGVVAINYDASALSENIKGLQLSGSGYGILVDERRNIITHTDETFIGVRMANLCESYADIADRLFYNRDVSEFFFADYNGIKSVAFFKETDNAWHVGVIVPASAYHSQVYKIIIFLSVACLVLTALLCAVFAFFLTAKKRADDDVSENLLLTNLSHEIRSTMSVISGMSELLLNEPLTSRHMDYANDIYDSSKSLLSVINEVLDLSGIMSGKLELQPVDYNFYDFIDGICSMFLFESQKKGLEFKYEEAGQMPEYLYGDSARLRQVLADICGNAAKHTSSGYIRLKVTAWDEKLTFEARDTGIGMRTEDLNKLFPISKTIIEIMQGELDIDSSYGRGTVFTVKIPIVKGSKNTVKHDTEEKGKVAFSSPSAKILIVDDNELNLKVVAGLLNLYKISADTAASGIEAVAMVRNTDYDIVFMDYMMPEMDGIEASCEIRRLGDKYKQPVIIALTADSAHDLKKMFLSNGLNDYASKPVDMGELAEILKKWLPNEKIKY